MVLERKRNGNFRRIKMVLIRAMCGVKLIDRRNSEELMDMLGIKKSLDRMAKASNTWWYGHVLRKEDENVIVKVLN